MKVLVLGRERHLVDASTAIIEENGFRATGVTRDDEALALLDTGQFTAVVVGSGVEFACSSAWSGPPHDAALAVLVSLLQRSRRSASEDPCRDPGSPAPSHLAPLRDLPPALCLRVVCASR